jgi:hypothetical protein
LASGYFIVEFDYDRYLIECDEEVAASIDDAQARFDKWAYAEDSPFQDGEGFCFGIDEFLRWLNETYTPQDKERARIVKSESCGLHHLDEFNEWLEEKGLSHGGVHFIDNVEEYNALLGTSFESLADAMIAGMDEAPPDDADGFDGSDEPGEENVEEDFDPLSYFPRFEEESGMTPEILRMYRCDGVPLIVF